MNFQEEISQHVARKFFQLYVLNFLAIEHDLPVMNFAENRLQREGKKEHGDLKRKGVLGFMMQIEERY